MQKTCEAVKRVVLVGLGDKEPSREAGAAIGGAIKRLKGDLVAFESVVVDAFGASGACQIKCTK